MSTNILQQIRGWLSSKLVPWFGPFWEAKKLHEGSPHGLFEKGKGLYRDLTPLDIESAAHCQRLCRAIQLYQECIKRESNAKRLFNHGLALQQLGLVLHRQGKLELAQKTYEDALLILEDMPDAEALPTASTCHFRLAEIFLERGNKRAANEHLEKGRSIDESMNDKGGLAMSDELRRFIVT